ncbi:MAG: hypothetical protein M3409_04050 [Gemmatimonadota bacterium]|nr:hypothetical protein [Gemmatimonadota bacterium]
MESQGEILRYVVEALEDLQIPDAIVGSIASIAYGEPRSTRDIDVVVDLQRADVPRLRSRFSAPEELILKKLEYYRSGESPKHLRDIAAMLQISGEEIDRGRIEEEAATLGLGELWKAVVTRVDAG